MPITPIPPVPRSLFDLGETQARWFEDVRRETNFLQSPSNEIRVPVDGAYSAGDYVNVYNDGGTAKARLADASDPAKQATGFLLENTVSGASANIFLYGVNTSANGSFAPGVEVFLSTTPGEVTDTAPTGSGEIVQICGTSADGVEVLTRFGDVIELA